ncbi:MAG: hypothetical protein JSV42_13940 [Chloroflexota bacterium]|nr:MAG: hypothetical protein JSV42_13940 [Chloroflexota bacterium]
MDQANKQHRDKYRRIFIVGILLTIILSAAAFLRFRGLTWGEYQYLHPDERFMIWVGTDISPVNNLTEYWNTAESSLNPHNRGHGFYVYGTLPLYLARYTVEWLYGQSGFNEMTNGGRFLSALADLLTVLFVFLVGEKVYNKWIGLLGASFSAFAVLQIQHAHFFTVDTFTTLFSIMAVYFAARVAYENFEPKIDGRANPDLQVVRNGDVGRTRRNTLGSFVSLVKDIFLNPLFTYSIGFGIALGLAVSSKISAAPVAILLPAGFLLRFLRLKGLARWDLAKWSLVYLIAAGLVSLFIFRVFQPMAFSGPGFFGVIPNEAWIANLRELQSQANGDVDFPPAIQWARRPIWFAWENMVRWGMGLPLGLLSWAGFVWIAWRMVRGEWKRHILLWGWTALIFIWQSSIFNPSMRYQLPIYPILAIFAGWAVLRIYDWGRNAIGKRSEGNSNKEMERNKGIVPAKQVSSPWGRYLAILLGGGVLLSAGLYAYAFSNIYVKPITRIAASRWIYENIPGPLDLPIESNDQIYNQHIIYPHNYLISPELPYFSGFTPKVSGKLEEIFVHKIIDPYRIFGDKEFRLKISEVPGGGGQSETATIPLNFQPSDSGEIESASIALENPLEVHENQEYYLHLNLPPGQGPLIVNGEMVVTLQANQIYHQTITLSDAMISASDLNLTSFTSPVDGFLTEIALNLYLPEGSSEQKIDFTISSRPDSIEPLASATWSGDLQTTEHYPLILDNPLQVEEGQEYFLKISLDSIGGAITLRGAAVANEGAWDDGLPVRLDGYDGFGGIYEPGLNFDMYEDDNPNKLSRFYDILDHTEYILISSSRQWGSLPRIPERFPMTSEYYRNLLGCPPENSIEWCYNNAQVGNFQGNLGFDLVQVFQSDPSIGSISLNDQASEEAFTVYDHPKVFIFHKRDDYEPENVRKILGAVDLTRVVHLTPKKAGEQPKNMMLPLDRLTGQKAGGTWSQLFDLNSIINRSPATSTVIWYLVVFLIGVVFYPILRFIFTGLADRGYPLSRTAGLLFLSYFVWLAGSAKIPFSRLTITIVAIILLGISGLFVYLQREDLRREWREKRGYFLLIEGLFLAFFLFDLLVRLGNPDLWHPWKGGEKPMDFSYFNAVLKSSTFPPFDPWFSGGYINYYYYGFVFIGVLVKWLGIVPSVAYNLIIPTLFSFIAIGSFSIGWNLVSAGKKTAQRIMANIKSSPFIAGIAAAFSVAVLGNLGTLRMIYLGYQRLAAPGGNIEGANIFSRIFWAIKGAFMTLTGSSMPYGIADWYWLPSRAIPAPNDIEPITEFPFFTVLYADPHAHLFALPLTILAIGWVLSFLFSRSWSEESGDSRSKSILRVSMSLIAGGLIIGALRPTNTWDFPMYLVLGIIAVGYTLLKYRSPLSAYMPEKSSRFAPATRIIFASIAVLLFGLLAFFLYQPYANWYVQGYTNIQLWRGPHTPFWSYLTHWGVFLFVIIAWLIWETREWMASTPLSSLRKLMPYRASLIISCFLILIWIIVLHILGISIAWFVVPLVIWSGIMIFRPGLSDAKRAVLVMITAGLAMTLMVEIIVLVGDIGRMNTVFKFYLQVWTLFAISAAVCLSWTLVSITKWSSTWRSIWQITVIVLVASAALYPLLGVTAKIKDRMVDGVPLTLDGMAFMQFAEYDDLGTRMDLSQDYLAIRWLQDNVHGSPVIIEGNMVEYHWGTRNTIYTGLPNVIGWNWHQRQQRALAAEDLIQGRISDVNEFYLTSDPLVARDILDAYGVEYILLGQLERALYPGPGLDKFAYQDGILWQEVFRTGDTVIYQVIES